jgi:hypothetical protein
VKYAIALAQQSGAVKVLGPIFLIVGLTLFLGAIVDPRGYFTKGFEENPPMWWDFIPRSAKGWRVYLALFGAVFTLAGIWVIVLAY